MNKKLPESDKTCLVTFWAFALLSIFSSESADEGIAGFDLFLSIFVNLNFQGNNFHVDAGSNVFFDELMIVVDDRSVPQKRRFLLIRGSILPCCCLFSRLDIIFFNNFGSARHYSYLGFCLHYITC